MMEQKNFISLSCHVSPYLYFILFDPKRFFRLYKLNENLSPNPKRTRHHNQCTQTIFYSNRFPTSIPYHTGSCHPPQHSSRESRTIYGASRHSQHGVFHQAQEIQLRKTICHFGR
ncbi:hypothetical protein CEXT_190971 [Caerostris extrusa]|uniref:Uncharacterized protein n=1 Tax=Caerostris extrusa TaxID=172846 RepID=A0AAV4QGV2_CAEEX|nr:hypothetical protein CEXT_190971 [Caerostris extrusa]